MLGVAHRRPQGEVLLNLVVSESGYKDVECRSILRLLVLVSPRVVILEIQVFLVFLQLLRHVHFFLWGLLAVLEFKRYLAPDPMLSGQSPQGQQCRVFHFS